MPQACIKSRVCRRIRFGRRSSTHELVSIFMKPLHLWSVIRGLTLIYGQRLACQSTWSLRHPFASRLHLLHMPADLITKSVTLWRRYGLRFQWPENTSVCKGRTSAWSRRIRACTTPTVSITWRNSPPRGAQILVGKEVVIVGIGIGDAVAPRRHPSNPPSKSGSRKTVSVPGGRLQWVDQLIRGPELAGRDKILNLGHHHRNDGERLRDMQVASAIMPTFMT